MPTKQNQGGKKKDTKKPKTKVSSPSAPREYTTYRATFYVLSLEQLPRLPCLLPELSHRTASQDQTVFTQESDKFVG